MEYGIKSSGSSYILIEMVCENIEVQNRFRSTWHETGQPEPVPSLDIFLIRPHFISFINSDELLVSRQQNWRIDVVWLQGFLNE